MTEREEPGRPNPRWFARYPIYKDSGIQWLGSIPQHWDVAPVYARYEVALGKMLDEKRITGAFARPYLRNVDVQWDRINVEDLPQMDFALSERNRYRLRLGDLMVCEGGEVGRTAVWRGELAECYYQKALHRVRPWSSQEEPRFFYYVILAAANGGVFAAGANANTIDHLTAVQLRHYRFAFPPLAEQREIATVLDCETARIDALIAKNEQLRQLLSEARATMIMRGVTKGLNPSVPVKDSGIEWLGEIPVHWSLASLGRVSLAKCDGPFGSGLKSSHYTTSGVRVIRLQNIGSVEFLGEDEAYVAEEYAAQLGDHFVIRNDLLVAGLGDEGHPVGRACVAPGKLGAAIVKADCFRFRTDDRLVLPKFAAYQLSASAMATAGRLANGATRSRINFSTMAARPVALPPIHEQEQIVAALEVLDSRQAKLLRSVEIAISRLRELRSALITAAVTGKIDVRDTAA